jgi:predicted dehydrogenase
MAAGKLPVEKLTTHRFDIENAERAYELITSRREPFIGILIDYCHPSFQDVLAPQRKVVLRAAKEKSDALGISMIGAGNFARLIMFPILSRLDDIQWRGLCTVKGMNAEHSGRKMDFAFATTDFHEVLKDESTEAVFIATRHDLHAELVIAALGAGKHVFVEKPLCINPEELDDIAQCVEELGARCPVLMVGFNRRFAPATAKLRSHFARAQPLSISYRFSPGPLPASSWPQDEEIGGGRIVGEACHAIDTCIALAGSAPVKVYAESVSKSGGIETTDDRVFITMRHKDGSISNVSYQAGGDRAAPVERIEVFGGSRTGVIESWDNVELWSGNKLERGRVKNDKGHKGELKAFIKACRDGGDWPIVWKDLYGTAWASLASVQSLRSGLPVEMD